MISPREEGVFALLLTREPNMQFIDEYINEVSKICKQLNKEKVYEMVLQLENLKNRNGRLFILGVGGSAGNASHAVNDFRKLTGIENLNKKDCLLILSVGGGDLEKKISVNLCRAIDLAKLRNTKILGITGRENGYTTTQADVCLVIPQVNHSNITPHSEAFQAIIWHLLVSHPKLKVNSTKW